MLNTQPSAAVTVALASDDTTAVTVSPAMLSFSTTTWNMAQNVMVTAVADADAASERVSVNYTVSGGDYASVTLAPQPVAVTDNDTAGLTSTAAATVALTEGGSAATYTIVLLTQPSAAVTVALASSDTGAVTVAPASLMFSTTTWNTAETVTVTAVADGNAADESVTISYTVSGGDYATVTLASQRVTVDDDESIGITSTGGSSVAVTEGSTNTYTLVLTSQPTAAVTVALSSSNATSVTVAGPGMTAAATTTLTFSTSNWNMAQTVTVTGVEETGGNANTMSETVSISYTVSGGDYAGFTLTAQSVAVTDNDVPGLTSTAAATVALTEGGSAGTYTIVLLTQPSAAVTVTPTSSDPGAVTVSPAMLNFSTTNWGTALTVTLTAVADDDATDESVNISYMVSGGDYATVNLAAQPVTVDDDETVGLTSTGGSSLTVTEGGMNTYTLALSSQPAADVMVALSSSNATAATVSPASLTFTSSNWNTAETVTVSSPANSVTANATASISYTLTSTDSSYNSLGVTAQSVAVTNVTAATVTGFAAAAGSTQVALSWTNPSGTASVRISATSGSPAMAVDISGDGSDSTNDLVLTIASGMPNSRTVTGLANGTAYTFSIHARDSAGNESAAATASATPLPVVSMYVGVRTNNSPSAALAEGSTSRRTIGVLLSTTAPTGGITVTLSRSFVAAGSAADFDESSALGGSGNTGRTLTIAAGQDSAEFTLGAVDDAIHEGLQGVTYALASGIGYSLAVSPTAITSISVLVTSDNDAVPTASIAVSPTTPIAENGGQATVTVTFSAASDSSFTVGITRSGTADIGSGNDYTVSGLSGTEPSYTLAVPATPAGTPGTASFTVTAVNDSADDDAETAIFTISSCTTCSTSATANAVTITIADDD